MFNLKKLKQEYEVAEAKFNQAQLLAVHFLLTKGLTRLKLPDITLNLSAKKRPVFNNNLRILELNQQIEKRRQELEEIHSRELRERHLQLLKLNAIIDKYYSDDFIIIELETKLAEALGELSADLLNYYSVKIK